MKAWIGAALVLTGAAAVAAVAPRFASPVSRHPAGRAVALAAERAPIATLARVVPPGPYPGDFLIAGRELDDANFARTVVLLLHTGPDGAAGVVINRPTPIRVATVLPQIGALSARPDRLYWGGPVDPQAALVLVRLAEAPPEAIEVLDDVHAVRARTAIEALLGRGLPESSLRVFTGHAGWAAGQLEWELDRGSWHLRPADADRIFTDEVESLWETLVRIARSPVA